MNNSRQLKDFAVGVSTNIAAPYKVVLFNALAPQVYNHYARPGYFNQPGFVSAQRPQLSTEGLLASLASGNTNGNIGWTTAPGSAAQMLGTSNDGVNFFLLASATEMNGYFGLLEFIKTQAIRVRRMKLTSNDTTQFSKDWLIVNRREDGSLREDIFTISNRVGPQQVNPFVLEFDCDILIDKYTCIEFECVPVQLGFSIIMYYEYAS